MKILGITGGIGSGKSFVCSVMREEFHIPVYDCDAEAKRLMNADASICQELSQLVGEQVLDSEGHINRHELASYLFASDEHADQVNAIVHPVVRHDFHQWCSAQQAQVVAMESAILYESGFDAEVDSVVFVDAPIADRLARAARRDQCSETEVRNRMARQSDSLARRCASWVIFNDKNTTRETIIKQLKRIVLC